MIPGLGAAVPLPRLDESYIDDVVMVAEPDTIRTCRRLARRGFLFGGSTGTVVRGALDWLGENDAGDLTAVAISPDLGERYLETVYTDEWVRSTTTKRCSWTVNRSSRRSCRRPGSRWAGDS